MTGKNDTFQGDSTSTEGSWKRGFYKEVAKELRITQLTPDVPPLSETDKKSIHEFPRWDLIQLTPDKSRPDKSVFLYGNEALVPLQISLVNAFYEMLSWTGGGDSGGGGLVRRSGYPLVRLFFEEDKPSNVASKDFTPVQARLSFRLMDYLEYPNNLNKEVLTWEKIERLAESIYREFQAPNDKKGYLWKKGKISYNYSDWNQGYGLKILCRTEQIGKEVLNKILRINGHRFNDIRASKSIPEKDDDYREGREITVLGEQQKAPRFRPNVIVRFRRADLVLSKRPKKPVRLITRGALERFSQG